jgi:uncharacterized repeat protein (TIGR02543 family)
MYQLEGTVMNAKVFKGFVAAVALSLSAWAYGQAVSNDVPYQETFESIPSGTSILVEGNTNGWYAISNSAPSSAVVTNISYSYINDPDYPVPGDHTKVLKFTDASLSSQFNTYAATPGTKVDFMFSTERNAVVPTNTILAGSQTALYVDTNGYLNVWHYGAGSGAWMVYTNTPIETGSWARATVEFDYSTDEVGSGPGSAIGKFFMVTLNDVPLTPPTDGYTRNIGNTSFDSGGGEWLLTANQALEVTQVRSFTVIGSGMLDDLVLKSSGEPEYQLTVENGLGSDWYLVNETVPISANTIPGQTFAEWIGDTATVLDVDAADTSLTMPANNITVTATYTTNLWSLTVNSGSGSGPQFIYGWEVDIVADTPPTGKVFDQWTGDVNTVQNVFAATTIVTMPDANVEVTATYKDAFYTLDVMYGSGDGTNYLYGAEVEIVADTPPTGKEFDQWTGDTSGVADVFASTTTVIMPDSTVALVATYKDILYTLTVTAGSGSTNCIYQQVVPIVADAPEAGTAFDKWTGDTQYVADENAATTTVTMPAGDVNLTATYKNVYTLTVTSGSGSGTLYTNDQQVTIVANAPGAGQVFDKWTGDTAYVANATAATTTVTMPSANISLTATYRNVYTLTVTDGSGSGTTYTNGQQVQIVADEKVGMAFVAWTGDTANVANVTSATTTVTMPAANISLTATYTVLSYTLTVENGTGGGSYTNGAVVEIVAAAPGAGQVFDKWTGATQFVANAASSTTTVTMPASGITLTATYKNVYVLTVENGTGDGSYTNGAQVQIVANAPAVGKAFDKWTGATQYVANAASSTTTVTMPSEAITLTATYRDDYVLTVVNGTGDGAYSNLQQVAIVADAPGAGQVFAKWTGATQYVANVSAASTFVTMPATNITVTATYQTVYALTVNGGDGSGSYTNGAKVTITATPVAGKAFFKWLGATQYVAGVTSATAVVTMPATNISLTASNVVDTTKPTVAIALPTAALRILSNATYTVRGTAADNKVVTNVMVKLNDGVYAPAITTNKWKNWSAQVQLVAGSNTVRAFSTDSAFNNSTTATVACTYVVIGNLTVQTNGSGKVTIAPTGAAEVGKSYTLTAAANTGSTFANWTGDNTTTNKVISFVMTSNKTFTANFTDNEKPKVVITAPTALQKVYGTNGDFIVRGTASDNLALSNVMVSVNGASAVPASTTTNGWKSWSLPVTLLSSIAGTTNTIAAYSVDTTGNHSTTSTVKCVYTETGALNITTNGPGKVTVAPAGPFLLGKTYTLTAAANAGAVFSNWVGNVAGNPTGKVVTVTLNATNKIVAVTANFTDTEKPKVVITYPANNAKVLTNGLVIIRGTASDNGALSEVKYQLYSGAWTNAVSTNVFKNWTADYVPVAGLNTSKVYSVDARGNSSATSTVVFTYIPGAVLTVQTNGNGTITPSLNGKVLQIGSTNTMTAAPKAPSVFVNWTAGIGGSVVTNGKLVKFVMTTNLVLTANFSLHAPDAVADVLAAPQTIVVDGATEDWAEVSRSSLTKDQDVAAVISGNKVALLLTGCPFGAADTFMVAFKLRLTYGEGDNRHIVDLWTSGSALYGMMDGKALEGLEAVLAGGVLEVQFPVTDAPSKVTIEEVGCMMDLGAGMTEVLGATLPASN